MKKNMLFITSHLPSWEVPQAGQKIACNMMEEYADHYDVYLIAFYNELEEKYIDTLNSKLFKYKYLSKVTKISRAVSMLFHLLLPAKAAVRANSKVKKLLITLQDEVQFDTVHFEYTSAAYYLKYIRQNVKTVITEHDITYQALERKTRQAHKLFKMFYYLEYVRQKKWELNILNTIDEIIVLNGKDKQLLIADGIASDKVKVVPPKINPIFRSVRRDNVEKYSILFWGAMNRKENIDAAIWFIENIFPLVLQKCDQAKLYVVGVKPAVALKKMECENIIITGYIEYPERYFEKCHVAIAPLRIGAGIKIKVLEYLEAGMSVVATTVGAEGVSHKNLIISDTAEDFAENTIRQLLR